MFLILKMLVLFLLSYIALNLYLFWKRRQYRHIASFPIPISLKWFMGHLPDLRMRINQAPEENFMQIVGEYQKESSEETVVLALFTMNLVLTLDLKIIPKLLTDRTTFHKREILRQTLGWCGKTRAFGNHGLLSDPGSDVWAAKRRIMDPAFTRSFLRTTMHGMNKIAERLVKLLNVKAECGQAFDISEYLDRAAFEAISFCGFNWSEEMAAEHGDAALKMARVMVELMAVAFKDPLSFKNPWGRLHEKEQFKNAVQPIRDLSRKHLERIGDKAVTEKNVLSHIIRGNDCSNDLTMEDLIDDYNVFLVAGMETTSITMACAVWFISMNPHVYEKAQAEVEDVFGDRDQICFEDVQKLGYLEMIIKESLRLKGPAVGTTRQCQSHGASISGVFFPKGTKFNVPYYNLHIDSRYWKDPHVFDPERFSPAFIKNIVPYTYMPFSTGPRNCIGKNFAILEMKVILANILRRFVVVNATPQEADLVMLGNITIRPKNGVNVRIFTK